MKHAEQELQTKICKWLKKEYDLIFFSDFAAGLYFENVFIRNLRSLQACEGKYPDLTILEPVGQYYGLMIEIKVNEDDLFLVNGKTLKSDHVQEQYNMIKKLRAKGYCADFGIGEQDIKQTIKWYMQGLVEYKPITERAFKVSKQDLAADNFFKEHNL